MSNTSLITHAYVKGITVMEFRHLRYFVVVAEELNFRRAAERLVMAQPPLSQQIHDLEEELGVALFYRTHRTVLLTAAGRIFLEDAYALLAQAEQAVHRVRKVGKGELGQLTIGYTSLIHNPHFPAVLRQHRKRYPDVELILRDLVTIEQMQQLRTNTLDISFATHASLAISSLEQGVLMQEPVWREPLGALLPGDHVLASRPHLSLLDLANESWIWFPRRFDPTTYDYMMRLFADVGFRPNITQEVNQQQLILSMVAAGLGISLAPKSAFRASEDENVVYRDLIEPTPTVEFNVVWRRNDPSPVLHALLDTIRDIAQDAARPK